MKCKQCEAYLRICADRLLGHKSWCPLFAKDYLKDHAELKPNPRRRAKPFKRWSVIDGLLRYNGKTFESGSAWTIASRQFVADRLNASRVVLPKRRRS